MRAREVALWFSGFRWCWSEWRREETGSVDMVTSGRVREGRERVDKRMASE
jgi:hypothetical protein